MVKDHGPPTDAGPGEKVRAAVAAAAGVAGVGGAREKEKKNKKGQKRISGAKPPPSGDSPLTEPLASHGSGRRAFRLRACESNEVRRRSFRSRLVAVTRHR